MADRAHQCCPSASSFARTGHQHMHTIGYDCLQYLRIIHDHDGAMKRVIQYRCLPRNIRVTLTSIASTASSPCRRRRLVVKQNTQYTSHIAKSLQVRQITHTTLQSWTHPALARAHRPPLQSSPPSSLPAAHKLAFQVRQGTNSCCSSPASCDPLPSQERACSFGRRLRTCW